MRLLTRPEVVPAGVVSFRVRNAGSLTHELVVLPASDSAQTGRRPTDAKDRVSESDALGEASRSCGAGAGEGITPGATGWVTLTLTHGAVELVCNLPHHYGAGMSAALAVA